MIKEWLTKLYDEEIENVQQAISNEHTWELGYDGEEPNPHMENIEELMEYIEVLKELKNAL